MQLYQATLRSRLLLGTARYPSPAVLAAAVQAARAEVVTVSLRRESGGERSGQAFWSLVRALGVRVLPNTAGCHSVKEALTTAHMAREVFGTTWIKLEVIGEDDTLQPDVFGLTEAARLLCAEGFEVFPYTTEDLVVAERLLAAGCRVLMPWGAPIGSGRGLNNLFGLTALRAHFPEVPLIIDAGLGVPSHAARRWSSASTRCSSTPRSPRRATRCRWRRRLPWRSRRARPRGWRGRSSRATWPHLPRRSSARRSADEAAARLSDRRQRRAGSRGSASLGVRLVQLRIKEQPPVVVCAEIRRRARLLSRGGRAADRQ